MDGSYLEKVWAKSAKRIIALGAEGEDAFLDVIRRKIEEAQDGEKEKLSIIALSLLHFPRKIERNPANTGAMMGKGAFRCGLV